MTDTLTQAASQQAAREATAQAVAIGIEDTAEDIAARLIEDEVDVAQVAQHVCDPQAGIAFGDIRKALRELEADDEVIDALQDACLEARVKREVAVKSSAKRKRGKAGKVEPTCDIWPSGWWVIRGVQGGGNSVNFPHSVAKHIAKLCFGIDADAFEASPLAQRLAAGEERAYRIADLHENHTRPRGLVDEVRAGVNPQATIIVDDDGDEILLTKPADPTPEQFAALKAYRKETANLRKAEKDTDGE